MDHRVVCRTCLADGGELFEVFGETGMELALPQKLIDHLKISVQTTDEYALMCGKCIGVLNEFHDMYSLAQEIQPHFEGLIAVEKITFKQENDPVVEMVEHSEPYADIVAGEYVEQEEEADQHLEEVIIEETIEETMDDDQVITLTTYAEDGIEADEDEMDQSGSEEEDEDEEVDTDYEEFSPQSKQPVVKVKSERKQLRETLTAEQREKENDLIRQMISLACGDCAFVSDTFENLIYHCREVHKKTGSLVCCNRLFTKRLRVVDHAKLHLDPGAFACQECGKLFSSRYSLSNHMGSHVPEDQCHFQCDNCPKKFSTKHRLKSHMKSHSDQSFVCHICNKAYTQKGTLYMHIRTVHERTSDPYMCEICAKPFKTKDAFLTHQVNHMETPPPRIACPICGKKMKNRDSLNQHVLRHKREHERHYCDVCNKEFNCKKRLSQHKKYVHNPEMFQCEHCDKTFKRPIYLKEHMASHTGESLYTCSYCPRQFNSNANKYSHQKAQHPVEWQQAKQKRLEEA